MQSSSLNPVRPTDESLSRLAGLFLQILLPLSGNIRLGEADLTLTPASTACQVLHIVLH
jgi:hypothetical protein